jgi:hypothetical protein
VRGYCETNNYLVAELLLGIAEMLEALDCLLKKKLGPEWWVGTDLERFSPKRKAKEVITKSEISPPKGRQTDSAPATVQKIEGGQTMNVEPYVSNGAQQGRLPLLDTKLFKKLEHKGVVTAMMLSCRRIETPRFNGLVMEFKSGKEKFVFLAAFDRWDISAIARKLGTAETDEWISQQVRFVMRKGQKGGEFINVENVKGARQ